MSNIEDLMGVITLAVGCFFVIEIIVRLVNSSNGTKLKKIEKQDFLDLTKQLELEIFEYKTSQENAVLIKAKNEDMTIQYVTDQEKNIRLYYAGEVTHARNANGKIIAKHNELRENFIVIRYENWYEIISRIEDSMLTFKGPYHLRNSILKIAKKYHCVPLQSFRNDS